MSKLNKVKVDKQLENIDGLRKNIERKQPSINDVVMHDGFPLFSWIELNINELCNRTCEFCPRVNPKTYPNQNLHMDLELAENIANQLDDLNYTGTINISGTGEPLLTGYVADIVRKFGEKGIHVEIVTNGDRLKPKLIKELYDAGLGQLVVSMYDGPEQIEKFNSLFKECGIDESLYSLRDRWYPPEDDYGLLYTNRAGFLGEKLTEKEKRACFYPHYSVYLDWNGDMLLCCQDMYNRTVNFGNVKEKQLFEIWKDAKLMKFREKLGVGDRSLNPCSNCTANGLLFGHNHVKKW
tara:strand:- start:3752 stop:4636 length:885 start_codon:yes stop_codon:yes gene_type:complete